MISSPWLAEMNITLVAAQCHTSATPATQNARPCRQVQSQPQCHKCHACLAKWRSMSPSATPATPTAAATTASNGNQARHQSQPASMSPSATPAPQTAAATTVSNGNQALRHTNAINYSWFTTRGSWKLTGALAETTFERFKQNVHSLTETLGSKQRDSAPASLFLVTNNGHCRRTNTRCTVKCHSCRNGGWLVSAKECRVFQSFSQPHYCKPWSIRPGRW